MRLLSGQRLEWRLPFFRWGMLGPVRSFLVRLYLRGDDAQEIALTYDDGPNDPYTLGLLEMLAQHNVRATFFLIGRYVRQRSDIVRQIQAAGHLIGNHTMTHPVLLGLSPAEVREELASCNAAIEDAAGEPVRFFRPPHGARSAVVLRIADELGLIPVMWNVTGRDWDLVITRTDFPPRRTESAHEPTMEEGQQHSLHDGGQAHLGVDRGSTLEATRKLLESWSHDEHHFVTIDKWGSEASTPTR